MNLVFDDDSYKCIIMGLFGNTCACRRSIDNKTVRLNFKNSMEVSIGGGTIKIMEP